MNKYPCEQIGNSTLYLGDCREILPTLGGVDVVISDPPYGSATHSRHVSKINFKHGEHARNALGFDEITEKEMVRTALQWSELASRWVVFTCEWRFMNALEAAGILVRFGIWRKPNGSPSFLGDRPGMGWEAVAICHGPGRKVWNGGGRHAFWNFPVERGKNRSGHPTQKPLALFASFVVAFTNRNELILDPFMGSGTTGVACAKLGRKFIGIERNHDHFKIACERIRQAYEQPDFFIPQQEKPDQGKLNI